ncbi:hypothetical protein Vafri_18064 [Volvox africanus]|uniref:RING-type domain-containing protein n=1 Tax=Volvox africanus TaxID=51714 RepID=A0A8J4FBD8_9CHLO|nr:hypothetical protein Vafri_18064 [Volvox africanus]
MASATVSAAVATVPVEMPTCPICLCGYRSGLRKPFDLGCGHCICGRCYASLSVTGPRTCPIDRSPWKNPHTAYELLHLLEQLQKSYGATPDAGNCVTPNPESQPRRRDEPRWDGYDPLRAAARMLLHLSDLWKAVKTPPSPDEDNTEMDLQELCGHLSLLLPNWFGDAFWLALPGLIAAMLCYAWRFIATVAILMMPCIMTVVGMMETQQPTSPGVGRSVVTVWAFPGFVLVMHLRAVAI